MWGFNMQADFSEMSKLEEYGGRENVEAEEMREHRAGTWTGERVRTKCVREQCDECTASLIENII